MTSAVVKVDSAQVTAAGVTSSLGDNWIKFRRFKSDKTRQTYNTCIKQMFKYFAATGITQPTRADLEQWLDGLKPVLDADGKQIGGKSAATVNLYATAARLFFAWLADEGIYKNIADKLKTMVTVDNTVHKKFALTAVEGAKLIQAAETHQNKKVRKSDAEKNLRDVAMIMMMMLSGCRTVELQRANVFDFIQAKQNDGLMPIQRKGHTHKDGFTRLSEQLMAAIEKYLAIRGIDTNSDDSKRDKINDKEPLFVTIRKTTIRNTDKTVKAVSQRGDRLSTQSISKITKKYLIEIGKGSKMYSAHCLRHTTANLLYKAKKAGAPIEEAEIQNLLGHKSISTTQIYRNDVDIQTNFTAQTAADIVFRTMAV